MDLNGAVIALMRHLLLNAMERIAETIGNQKTDSTSTSNNEW